MITNPGSAPHLKTLNLIISAKPFLPCEVTHSQVPGLGHGFLGVCFSAQHKIQFRSCLFSAQNLLWLPSARVIEYALLFAVGRPPSPAQPLPPHGHPVPDPHTSAFLASSFSPGDLCTGASLCLGHPLQALPGCLSFSLRCHLLRESCPARPAGRSPCLFESLLVLCLPLGCLFCLLTGCSGKQVLGSCCVQGIGPRGGTQHSVA